jgi:uncharacterized protein YqgC (DUF456 family)
VTGEAFLSVAEVVNALVMARDDLRLAWRARRVGASKSAEIR